MAAHYSSEGADDGMEGRVTHDRRIALAIVAHDEEIVCELHRAGRGARNLTLRVRPDGSVRVGAPRWVSLAEIRTFVQQHADWIVAERRSVARLAPRYVTGAPQRLLGRTLTLVVRAVAGRARIEVVDQELHLSTTDIQEAAVRARLRAWYRGRAEVAFRERGEAVCAHIDWLSTPPLWRQRWMRTQWGNCSAYGEITLNTHLVKAAPHLIDYVIQHEVCHLEHHDHGIAFQRLMDFHMPDWRARRRELNANSGLLAD